MRIGRVALVVAVIFVVIGIVTAIVGLYLPALVWVALGASMVLFDTATVLFPKQAREAGHEAVGLFQGFRNLAGLALFVVAVALVVVQAVNGMKE